MVLVACQVSSSDGVYAASGYVGSGRCGCGQTNEGKKRSAYFLPSRLPLQRPPEPEEAAADERTLQHVAAVLTESNV